MKASLYAVGIALAVVMVAADVPGVVCPDGTPFCPYCRNKPTWEACLAGGDFQRCTQAIPVCKTFYHNNTNGDVSQYFTGCAQETACLELESHNDFKCNGRTPHNNLCWTCNVSPECRKVCPSNEVAVCLDAAGTRQVCNERFPACQDGVCVSATDCSGICADVVCEDKHVGCQCGGPASPTKGGSDDDQCEGPCEVGALRACWTCRATSALECALDGVYEECNHVTDACLTHIHRNAEVSQYVKRCFNPTACKNLEKNNDKSCAGQNNEHCYACDDAECIGDGPCPADTVPACLTCSGEASEADCLANGQVEVCGQADAVCHQRIYSNPNGDIIDFWSNCESKAICDGLGDTCPDNVCRPPTCIPEPDPCASACDDPCPDVDGGKISCWTCNSDNEQGCDVTGAYEICLMSDPKCQTRIVKNATNDVVQFTSACADPNICQSNVDSSTCGDTYTCDDAECVPQKVDECEVCEEDTTAACWTCTNELSEADCQANGAWVDCTMSRPMCEMHLHLNRNGDVSQLTRGCKQKEACLRHLEKNDKHCDPDNNNQHCYECDLIGCHSNDPCPTGGEVSCFVCKHGQPLNVTACDAVAEWEVCHQNRPVCNLRIHTNENGQVSQYRRECDELRACEAKARNSGKKCPGGGGQNNQICYDECFPAECNV